MESIPGIDPSSPSALHRQVYESLRSAILGGRFGPGDRLPATRALAEQLSLSRTTIAEAYDQLQAEGYIEGRHGSGTFVACNLPRERTPSAGQPREASESAIQRLRLSRWGQQAVAQSAELIRTDTAPGTFAYDFRPHRVAADMFPWDAWKGAVDRALNGSPDDLGHAPAAGYLALRRAIAEHVVEHRAVRCSADEVVVVNGTQQGLNLLAELLLDRGDAVAMEDPGYPAARVALQARGLRVARVPVDGEGLVADTLAKGEPCRIVHVTPSHQDPTGATLSLGRRLALLDVARRWDCIIVEDDYDSEFRYEGRPVESLQALDGGNRVVYAGTFSKSMLPGLRIGYLILPPLLVQAFVAAKSLWDSGAPMLEQMALYQFMRAGDFERHIRRMRRLYRGRRDALVDALTASFGDRAQVGERQGGLNVLVTLDVPARGEKLVVRAARAGIGLRSAAPYYTHPPARPTFLMGFGALAESSIIAGVQRLAELTASSA